MSSGSATGGKLVGGFLAGLKVVQYLVAAEAPVGVSKVARDLKISPSTCFNLLKTLVHVNLAEFDPLEKTYTAGFGILELSKGLLDKEDFVRFVRPRMQRIASAHRVTCTLWRKLGADRTILVDRADIAAAVRVHMSVGQRLPLFIGALGRCFAAHTTLPREEVRREFDLLRWDNRPEFSHWWKEVQAIKNRGYAIDQDAFVRGITTVAAPIVQNERQVEFVISAIGFTGQFNLDSVAALGEELRDEAARLAVGYNGADDAD
ncbi:MAG: IclR family transcriptional regulator [Pseudomonadota bacterium]|nr:IclR family transcriptional regulator [Pseudomonadota bacterium]